MICCLLVPFNAIHLYHNLSKYPNSVSFTLYFYLDFRGGSINQTTSVPEGQEVSGIAGNGTSNVTISRNLLKKPFDLGRQVILGIVGAIGVIVLIVLGKVICSRVESKYTVTIIVCCKRAIQPRGTFYTVRSNYIIIRNTEEAV